MVANERIGKSSQEIRGDSLNTASKYAKIDVVAQMMEVPLRRPEMDPAGVRTPRV